MRVWTTPLVGYHGCDKKAAESVLSGNSKLKKSENDHDWLGNGIYFWVNSYDRAMNWAKEKYPDNPYVIGAFILPKNCLDLTDYGVAQELKEAYEALNEIYNIIGREPPKNCAKRNGIFMSRQLDCTVIETLHSIREDLQLAGYDAVYGFFEEGNEIFPGSALKEKTHIQIAIRNHNAIIGYFRPQELCSF